MTETVLSHAPLTGPDLARACGVTTLPVSALLTFPTGSGKTHLALEAAQGTLTSGGTVIVLLPLKALVEELLVSWSAALPGAVVQGYTSDTRSAKPYRDAQVMLMTAERLDLLLRNWRRHHAWLARVRVLVADEVHLIADPSRGAALDSAVTRLRFVNPLLRVLALTATCGNPEDLARWLGGVHIGGGERPVPLDWKAMTLRDAREKPGLLPELLSGGESTLVFVHSRKRCEELAEKFADFGAEAYHAGLISTDRLAVAGRYRSGQTRVLFTTPALELGLNFACRHAVLYDLTLPDAGAFKQIGVNAAWQRAGRAGRVRGKGPARATVIGSERERPERYLAPVPRAHQTGVSLSFSLERPQIRDTGTPTGRVLARIELVCCEILAGDVPRGGAADWCRRLIVKKPCGVSSPLTEQARRLALALNAPVITPTRVPSHAAK